MDASSILETQLLTENLPKFPADSEMIIIASGEAEDEMSEISTQSEILRECTEKIILEENQVTPSRSLLPSGSMSSKKSPEIKKKFDWSSHVPNNLKRKANGKLHPATTNPIYSAKQEYYKRKKELLEKTVEAEEMKRSRKMEREEEHLKKMILLDLEIKLKQKQLHKENIS